jgi:hypothetical protein
VLERNESRPFDKRGEHEQKIESNIYEIQSRLMENVADLITKNVNTQRGENEETHAEAKDETNMLSAKLM